MISGAAAAALGALFLLMATVGATAVGFWASGASPETSGNLAVVWLTDDFATTSFVTVVLGLICGLGTPLGLLIGVVGFVSLIGFLRSETLRVESFFILFICGVTAGFKTANAVYQPYGIGGWRIVVATVVPVLLYLALRLPGWVVDRRLSRSQRAAEEGARGSSGRGRGT